MAKRIVCDGSTGEIMVEDFDFTPPTLPPSKTVTIDLDEVKRLIEYAKTMGWI